MAKQVAQVLQDGLGPGRILAHQRDRAVEGIEQEMRPDPRLQFGQARRGIRRHAAFGPQHQRGHQRRRQQGAGERRSHPGHRADKSDQRQQARSRRCPPAPPAPCQPAAGPRAPAAPGASSGCRPRSARASVAGKAAPLSTATRTSQSATPAAPNMAPTDITVSTNSTARRITPTWQASNTSTRAGGVAGAAWPGRSWNADKICESFIKDSLPSARLLVILA